MAIVINGSGTVTGISVGGLPDGIVDAGTLATNSVDSAELIDGSIDTAHIATDQITSAILPAGSVLQVVQGTTATATASASTSYVSTSITATITPSSTSNKVLIFATSNLETNTGSEQAWFSIYDGSSDIVESYLKDLAGGSPVYPIALSKLDSPSTTSAVTYTVRMKATSSTIVTNIGTSVGVITLMEIAG